MTDILKSILATMILAGCLFSLAIAATALADDESEAERLVNEAVEFWSGRTSATAQAKLAYFTLIRDALTSGDVSDALMARVTASWEGANPGGRMYATWEAAFNALTALREAATVEEVPEPEAEVEAQEDEQQEPEFDLSELEIPPPADDQEVVQLSEDVPVRPTWYSPPQVLGTPAPAWFNPGGGYSSQWHEDGYAGWYTTQWGEEFSSGDTTEDRCDDSGVCSIFVPRPEYPGANCSTDQLKCQPTANPDGIPDYTYHSYEDAAFTHPRWGAKMAWGEWGELPSDVRAAAVGIDLPSFGEIAAELGATATGYGFAPSAGTAIYEGEAVGVFRPDLFGTVYGTKDDPGTADKNEYDDGGPRVSLTANFEKGIIDGELTARMTAQRLGFGPPVREYLIRNRGLGSGYRWHSAHSHFFECPDSTCAATYTAVRADSRNDGDYTYVHGRIETTVDVDEMLRTPVVRWNGVRITGTDDFEGQGLYGELIATCSVGSGDDCIWSDATAAIRGYINHPRFVGSYGAAKCASDGTCPGFEMPDLVPGTVQSAMDSWGPWDDLPLATQQGIAGTATVADMTARKKHTGDNRTFWLPNGIGLTHGGPIRETWWVPTSLPSSGTATWRTHGDSFNAVINPAYSSLSEPILTLTADLTAGTIGAGITFMESGSRTGALESWSGLVVTDGGFSGDGLTGQVHNWRLKYLQGSTVIQSHNTGAAAIFGTVNADRVVGTYQAQRD